MTGLDDIAAMRADGDLGDYMRSLAAGGTAKPTPPVTEPEPVPDLPRARPGAWPTGSRPPQPVPAAPMAMINAALTDYRQWIVAGCPRALSRCDCPACRKPA